MGLTKKPKEKSHSERLRNVFFNIWGNDPEEFEGNFDAYYASKMEKLINYYILFYLNYI